MPYAPEMRTDALPSGPDPEAIARWILERYPETDVVEIPGASFFSLDPERHSPNYVTIVTTDDFDEGVPSRLSRPSVFRVNVGVGRATFERLVGSIAEPDDMAFDRVLPHPVYAKQSYVCILNPSEATFRDVVAPLIVEAHDKLATTRARHLADAT